MILLVLASLSVSCGRKNPIAPLVPQNAHLPSSATEPEAGPYVVVGHLVHRDRVVTVKTGGQGTVYSVLNSDGKILFDNLTAEQLKMQSPEIHTFIESGTAGFAGIHIGRMPIWAERAPISAERLMLNR